MGSHCLEIIGTLCMSQFDYQTIEKGEAKKWEFPKESYPRRMKRHQPDGELVSQEEI